MAAIPNLETILLAINEALGLPAPKKKQELKNLKRPFDIHVTELAQLLDEILVGMGLDAQGKFDAESNLKEFADFHKTLETMTWTFGAELRQVLWHLLACAYAPGLARRAAFWQLVGPVDSGMPGGSFWYLPHPDPTGGPPRLRMPLATVLDWLEDLLGQQAHKATDAWAEKTVDTESVKRTLTKWRSGDIPRGQNIERYFAEGTRFEFRGCLAIGEELSTEQALDTVRAFLNRKALTADDLRRQIPMTAPGRIEAVLAGSGTSDEAAHFIALVKTRYAQPSLRTIRNRFLTARATQHAYIKIHQLLCPNVSIDDIDPQRNKVLQLLAIYAQTYNLTIKASEMSSDWHEQDVWFEQHLPPWDRMDLFLSILPSKRTEAARELAEVLSKRFASTEPDAPLEDWTANDTQKLRTLVQRRKQRLEQEIEELDESEHLRNAVRDGSVEGVLQAARSYHAISRIAADRHMLPSSRRVAVQRMRELAATDAQRLDASIIELDLHLNAFLTPAPDDSREVVERLLNDAEANPARLRRMPQLLNARAKHHVRCNEFPAARNAFAAALDACLSDSCGDLPGLIARDAFALECAVKPNGFSVGNCERFWRFMLSFGVIGPDLSLEQTAKELESYFRDDFYRPYPGVERGG